MVLGIIMVIGAAGVGVWAHVLSPGSSESPAQTASAPDPGIAACQALAQAASDPEADAPPAGVFDGFKASDNADVRAAATVLEPAGSMTEEQQNEIFDELSTAAGQLHSGCAALGVQLPLEALALLD